MTAGGLRVLICQCVIGDRLATVVNIYDFGVDVKEMTFGLAASGTLMLATMILAACGTPPAKDFGGAWHPVNRYRSAPTEIPLHRRYTFFAAPIDETLKSMLTRWANDTDSTLNYQLSYDVTLYSPVATIRTTHIEVAASELNSIYAAQGVRVTAKPGEIVVQSTNRLAPPSAITPGNASNSEAATP